MRRHPSPAHHRPGRTRVSIALAVLAGLLALVIVLPHDHAALVAGILCTLATIVVPAWLNQDPANTPRARRTRHDRRR